MWPGTKSSVMLKVPTEKIKPCSDIEQLRSALTVVRVSPTFLYTMHLYTVVIISYTYGGSPRCHISVSKRAGEDGMYLTIVV